MLARVRPSSQPNDSRAGRLALLGWHSSSAARSPLAAQDPAQRTELERFRDSRRGHRRTPVGLLALEKRMIDAAKADRSNAMVHLRLGFLSLRLGELGGQSHYDDAASEFQWAIDLQPTWPYGWYGMGLAEYGVGDSQVSFVTGIKTMLGKDALTRSAMAFAKSAEVDPAFVRGPGGSGQHRAPAAGQHQARRGAGGASPRRPPRPPAAIPRCCWPAGGSSARWATATRPSSRSTATCGTGPNRSLGLLEVARTLFLLGRFDGMAPYFEGAASTTPTTVAGYRARPGHHRLRQRAAVSSTASAAPGGPTICGGSGASATGSSSGPTASGCASTTAGSSTPARTSSSPPHNRHYDIVERYRSGSRDFDDRGVIYIRHGEPTSRASYAAPGLEPNESWRYSRPDGDLIFHFIAREDVQDFKLVESLFDVLGFSNAAGAAGGLTGAEGDPVAQQLMLSREQLSPIYGRLQAAGRISTGRYQTEERQAGQESIALGTTSDSYELRFPDELKVHVRGARGRPRLQRAPRSRSPTPSRAPASSRSRSPAATSTRVRVRFVATDRMGRVVASLDTTRHFVAPAPVPPRRAPGRPRVASRVPPGQFRVPPGDPAGRGDAASSCRATPCGSAGRPPPRSRLSDLVLGSRNANLSWRRDRGRHRALQSARAPIKRSEDMELYYEIEGLRAGDAVHGALAVRKQGGGGGLFRKIFGGGGAAISLKFEEQATFPVATTHRSLKLDRLKPGQYMLEVLVEDGRAGRTGGPGVSGGGRKE